METLSPDENLMITSQKNDWSKQNCQYYHNKSTIYNIENFEKNDKNPSNSTV